MAKTAFIGLGVMGYPMAGHLKAKGHEVTIFNRTAARAEAWVTQHKGQRGANPAEAAKGADFVFVCVGNDHDVRSVLYGPTGVLAGMRKGAVLVDHTTASAELAREIAEKAKEPGIEFLDAPVSGGQAGAEKGQLTVMVGGKQAAYDRAKPVIDSYARACVLLGDHGSGQLAKMVNQICIAGVVQGLAEGLHFAKRAGLDPQLVYDAISKGAAQSWQMDNRWKTMTEGQFEFGFAV
ncbi:MAG TPA: NAD(P)-dependent oxidoreductase, partial [Dongiaceae bacterium]